AQRSTIHGLFGALYPVYVRGEAYLASHDGTRAIAAFQEILAHPGIVVSDPVGPLARLSLARAYTLAGDQVKARGAYEDFLNRWKNSDSDVPLLLQAKTEYARLR